LLIFGIVTPLRRLSRAVFTLSDVVVRGGSCLSGGGTLVDHRALVLGHGVSHEATGRCGEVDALMQRLEHDGGRPEKLDGLDQGPEASTEPVEITSAWKLAVDAPVVVSHA
jgi:hypothetical protein